MHGDEYEGIQPLDNPFTMVQFFLLIVVVEHIVMVIKIVLEMIIDDVPESAVVGEHERTAILGKFRGDKKKGKSDQKVATLAVQGFDKVLSKHTNFSYNASKANIANATQKVEKAKSP